MINVLSPHVVKMVVITNVLHSDTIREEALQNFEIFLSCESVFSANEQENVSVSKVLG